ncbi:dynein axonemal heavy chain 10-like [Prorops nasuta]|uniref:dynein axonemal heavy chain 10-like n=1 Tax=Prorops nasuta TaxID=863751 RepID=UPI0034CE98E5
MPDFVPPPGEESKYVLRKKLVEVMRRVPILSMMHGDITVDPGKENELKNVNIFYFVRSRDEGIPELSSYEECIATIPSYLVVGSMNGKFLNSLERLLTQVFKPLVESQFAGEVRSKVDIDRKPKTTTWHGNPANMVHRRGSSFKRPSVFRGATIEEDEESLPRKDDERSPEGGLTHIKRDILIYLDQLAESVEWSMEHIDIEGNALLTMPEESSLDSVDRMEEIVSFWAKQVVQVIDEYSKRSALGKGPLAEHRHWHDLETVLSMLIEQLKSPKALNTLELLNKASSEVASDFQYTKNELWKRYTQARENNQFLVTVFRYFKYMTDSDSFRAIRESLASLMEALRMIWILSSYYSQEERMQALMEKISWQLCDNVKRNLPICKLFE